MGNPSVENLKPGEAGTFSPTDPISFSVRDGDSTRVTRTSVNSLITFSKTTYQPTSLPSGADYFDVFNDVLPESRPSAPVDRYLMDDIPYDSDGDSVDDDTYGPVLVLEKAVAGEATEKGILFVEADAGSEPTPVGCEIRMGIQSYTTGPADYFADPDYVGALAGFVYWPLNTGVFFFFKDDGATKSVVVCSPAQNGAGDRNLSQETVLDWAGTDNAPVSFRVVLDPTPRLYKVWVFATSEVSGSYEETLLFEAGIDDLGQFQAAGRIGNYYVDEGSNKIAVLAGISSGGVSDYVEIHSLQVDEYGTYLVAGGGPAVDATYSRRTSDSLLVQTIDDLSVWNTEEVTDLLSESGTVFSIEKDSSAENAAAYFEESDLKSRQFLLLYKGSVRLQDHSGSQSTGIGVDVDDGTSLTALRFLDDFSTYRLGIFNGSSRDATADFSTTEIDWSDTTPEILVFADQAQGVLKAYVSTEGDVQDEVAPVIDTVYSTTASQYSLPSVALGFVDSSVSGVAYGGRLSTSKLLLLPNCTFFHPLTAYVAFGGVVLPSDSGTWSAWSSVEGGSSSVSSGVVSDAEPFWSIEPTTNAEYEFFFQTLTDQEYSPGESGISLFAQVQINSWIDQFGVSESIRVPTASVLAIDMGDELFLQLQAIKSATGEFYLYFSQDAQDYIEVLNQTEAGIKISTAVDGAAMHYIMVSLRPGDGIYVYLDLDSTPSISIPWEDKSSVQRSSDVLTSGTHSVSVGAIPYSSAGEALSLTLGPIGYSVGSGFDFRASLSVSDSVLEDKVYGARANVLVDVSDED